MRRPKGPAFLGLGLMSLQLGIALAVAPGDGWSQAYERLCQWDCRWYLSIASEGYHSSVPPVAQKVSDSNVGFFPAYPYLARTLARSTGTSPKIALLVIAQLFCAVFWGALWALLRRWRIPPSLSALVVLAVFAHPASFFLIAGYSESLFLSSLLLFVLFASRTGSSPWNAALWGMVMSATRLVGIPAAVLPLFKRFSLKSALVSAFASAGALLFFAYCEIRFGEFDLYMQTQRIGWNIHPDYAAIFRWRTLNYYNPLERAATLISVVAFIGLTGVELAFRAVTGPASGLRRRLPIYAVAFLIFYITLSGMVSINFRSMIRYTLPWFILLLLCAAHLSLRIHRLVGISRPWAIALWLGAGAGLGGLFARVQLPHLRDFLNGLWFA